MDNSTNSDVYNMKESQLRLELTRISARADIIKERLKLIEINNNKLVLKQELDNHIMFYEDNFAYIIHGPYDFDMYIEGSVMCDLYIDYKVIGTDSDGNLKLYYDDKTTHFIINKGERIPYTDYILLDEFHLDKYSKSLSAAYDTDKVEYIEDNDNNGHNIYRAKFPCWYVQKDTGSC